MPGDDEVCLVATGVEGLRDEGVAALEVDFCALPGVLLDVTVALYADCCLTIDDLGAATRRLVILEAMMEDVDGVCVLPLGGLGFLSEGG